MKKMKMLMERNIVTIFGTCKIENRMISVFLPRPQTKILGMVTQTLQKIIDFEELS